MIKNNKGVTLVELLIVIVVMGIIAAFAIPAVGTIITNTEKDAIVADAIAVKNAADLYCASTSCDAAASLTWAMLQDNVSGISGSYYEFDSTPSAGDVTGDVTIASRASAADPWTVTLTAYSVTDYDWPAMVPSDDSQTNRSNVAP